MTELNKYIKKYLRRFENKDLSKVNILTDDQILNEDLWVLANTLAASISPKFIDISFEESAVKPVLENHIRSRNGLSIESVLEECEFYRCVVFCYNFKFKASDDILAGIVLAPLSRGYDVRYWNNNISLSCLIVYAPYNLTEQLQNEITLNSPVKNYSLGMPKDDADLYYGEFKQIIKLSAKQIDYAESHFIQFCNLVKQNHEFLSDALYQYELQLPMTFLAKLAKRKAKLLNVKQRLKAIN